MRGRIEVVGRKGKDEAGTVEARGTAALGEKPDDARRAAMYEEGRIELRREIAIEQLVTIYYFEFARDYHFAGEAHDFWEFIYVDKGEVTVRADDLTIVVGTGMILFHRPNEFHSFQASGGTAPNIVVASFFCRSPAMRAFERRWLRLGNGERDLLANIVRDAKTAFEFPFHFPLVRRADAPIGAEQRLLLRLELFLLQLLDLAGGGRSAEAEPLQSPARERGQRDLVAAAKQYMERHLAERVTLGQMSGELHAAATTLKQAFKRETGQPVMKYFLRLKIERAKTMIREGDATIAEIADRLGFASAHYFSRAFRRETGLGPSEYARSVKARSE